MKSKKKGQIEKLFNDFLRNRDYFQQNLKRWANVQRRDFLQRTRIHPHWHKESGTNCMSTHVKDILQMTEGLGRTKYITKLKILFQAF